MPLNENSPAALVANIFLYPESLIEASSTDAPRIALLLSSVRFPANNPAGAWAIVFRDRITRVTVTINFKADD